MNRQMVGTWENFLQMNEVEHIMVIPKGHGVGRKEQETFGVDKIVAIIENDQEASPSISRSPRKIISNSGASTS